MKTRVLIVDDDDAILTQMKWALAGDHEVSLTTDRRSALDAFRQHKPSVVLLDLGLPPEPSRPTEGMAALAAMRTLDRHTKIIIVSGQGDRANAVRAIGAGAYDFLCKPIDLVQLKTLLLRCAYVSELEREYRQSDVSPTREVFEGMLGESEAMREIFSTIQKVSTSAVPVLILGESGTGKEMVAAAIHHRGANASGPFVAINCNAIPEPLIESELFGHEKGSFTGALGQRVGMIETAAGGTLFLDEIGDLPPTVQVKLLRFLQDKTIQRVGGRQPIEIETRVLAATHVDLGKAREEGRFREDLYYRLAVVTCKLPPLREREGDIRLLAEDFLRRFAKQNGRVGLELSPEALASIHHHPWPGNVRELQNRVLRAVVMADGPAISPGDLELDDHVASPQTEPHRQPENTGATDGTSLKSAREQFERQLVRSAMDRQGGNISATAKELGISRPTLYELMAKLRIPRP